MSGRKRRAYCDGKIGAVSAELCEQVKRNRKNQPCHDHHRFENGARFEWLLRFAAVTSGWRQNIGNAWDFPRTRLGVVVSSDGVSNSDRELDPVSNLEVPQNFICSPDAQSTRIIDTLPDCDGSVRHVCCSSLPYQHPASHQGGHFAEFFALTLR
jgi:hypothetical protein